VVNINNNQPKFERLWMYKLYSTVNLQTRTNHSVVQPAEADIIENVICQPLMF